MAITIGDTFRSTINMEHVQYFIILSVDMGMVRYINIVPNNGYFKEYFTTIRSFEALHSKYGLTIMQRY